MPNLPTAPRQAARFACYSFIYFSPQTTAPKPNFADGALSKCVTFSHPHTDDFSAMARAYSHLSPEERATIMIERQANVPAAKIARMLGRSPTTITRELRRVGGEKYDATKAAKRYKTVRLNSRRKRVLQEGTELYQHVYNHLVHRHWSPEQVAGSLRDMPEEKRPGTVSHKTIYATIRAQPKGALKKAMQASLRQPRRYRTSGNAKGAGASYVPEQQKIGLRPQHIDSREFVGHWEGDLIKGTYNRSAVGVLVERKTRYVVLCKMDGCTADHALEGFTRQMKKLPRFIRQSMTYDRGCEMACHEELSKRLKLDIWFCDPHAPWQRGSNENTNGLLRQYMPKGTDLSSFSQTTLNDIARMLNSRPRKLFRWKTPQYLMNVEIEKFMQEQNGSW